MNIRNFNSLYKSNALLIGIVLITCTICKSTVTAQTIQFMGNYEYMSELDDDGLWSEAELSEITRYYINHDLDLGKISIIFPDKGKPNRHDFKVKNVGVEDEGSKEFKKIVKYWTVDSAGTEILIYCMWAKEDDGPVLWVLDFPKVRWQYFTKYLQTL